VDATGCGDPFDAGFITTLHHKMDVETSLRFAQGAVAQATTSLGSDAGIVSLQDTFDRMNRGFR
jgi:sugar/nucleoside kinase (ribokinase family)